MSDRRFIVAMELSRETKPFWDRHFTSILAFVGVVIAAALAISDTGLKLFVNQPPDVQIILMATAAPQGTRLDARAIVSDPDGKLEDIWYRWEMLGSDLILLEGLGKKNLAIPTNEVGKFTLLVTVTDRKGKGKPKTAEAKLDVIPPLIAPAASLIPASASTAVSGLQPDHIHTVDVISLTGPEKLDWSQRRAKMIITNGHKLELIARSLDRDIVIRSFDVSAGSGKSGEPGLPGINGGTQQAGTDGRSGGPGGPGEPGKSAGDIIVQVSGPIAANLTIINSGQNGGDGGLGGQGGPGGSGGQGVPAQQGILDCRSGPGFGGAGGDGGEGGAGGRGGDGGNAGSVQITALTRTEGAKVDVTAKGGESGKPGSGGQGGIPGRGGPEGSSGGFCSTAGRSGQNGRTGGAGKFGVPGAPGEGAAINASVGNKDARAVQVFKLP